MTEDTALDLAIEIFRDAYRHQMEGDLSEAAELYHQSIETYPTAEAYTFLGWTCSFMGDYDAAIAECMRAIEIDPDFGNPYNDIGAYLIEKGRLDEATIWLEKAKNALRYDFPAYPHFNLGRVWERRHNYARALASYLMAVELDPDYELAKTAAARLRATFN